MGKGVSFGKVLGAILEASTVSHWPSVSSHWLLRSFLKFVFSSCGLLLGNKSDTGPSLGRRCLTDSGHPGRKGCLRLRERRLLLLEKFPDAGSGLGGEGSLAGPKRSCPRLPESK